MLKIIKCKECGSKFDVTSFDPGTKIKCSVCQSLLEVPADKVAVQAQGSGYFRESDSSSPPREKNPRTKTSRTHRLSVSELEARKKETEKAESKPAPEPPKDAKSEPEPKPEEKKKKKKKKKKKERAEAVKAGAQETAREKPKPEAEPPREKEKKRPKEPRDKEASDKDEKREAKAGRTKTSKVARREREEPEPEEDRARRRTDKTRRITERTRRQAEDAFAAPVRKRPPERAILIGGGILLLVLLGSLVAFGLIRAADSGSGSDGDEAASAAAEFKQRFGEAQENKPALLELAEWCKSKNLGSERKRVFEQILSIDPENEAAHTGLGHASFHGSWMAAAEAARLEQWLDAIEKALDGKAAFRKGAHFDIVAPDDEEAKEFLDSLDEKMEDRLEDFFESRKTDFQETLSAPSLSAVPRRRIVVFGTQDVFKGFAEDELPEMAESEGYVDRAGGTCYLYRYAKFLETLPFYDNFLGALYFPPREDGATKEHILSPRTLEAFQVMGSDAQIERSPHFLVGVQNEEGYSAAMAARTYCNVLEELYRGFFEKFAKDLVLTPPDREMPMFIFKDRDAYVAYGQATGKGALLGIAEGHYEPDKGRMMSFKKEREQNYSTILHEGTHLIFHYLAGNQSILLAFNEGIADYFAGFRRDSTTGHFVLGEPVNKDRLPILQKLYSVPPERLPEEWRPFEIKELITFSYRQRDQLFAKGAQYAQVKMNVLYAQGWGLTHFMMEGGNQKYRKMYIEYVKAELDKKTGPEVITRTFNLTDAEYRKLENEFKDYVKGLKAE